MKSIGQEMTHNRFVNAQGVPSEKMLLRASSEFYEKKGGWKSITIYKVNGLDVLAENQDDAYTIYNSCKEILYTEVVCKFFKD